MNPRTHPEQHSPTSPAPIVIASASPKTPTVEMRSPTTARLLDTSAKMMTPRRGGSGSSGGKAEENNASSDETPESPTPTSTATTLAGRRAKSQHNDESPLSSSASLPHAMPRVNSNTTSATPKSLMDSTRGHQRRASYSIGPELDFSAALASSTTSNTSNNSSGGSGSGGIINNIKEKDRAPLVRDLSVSSLLLMSDSPRTQHFRNVSPNVSPSPSQEALSAQLNGSVSSTGASSPRSNHSGSIPQPQLLSPPQSAVPATGSPRTSGTFPRLKLRLDDIGSKRTTKPAAPSTSGSTSPTLSPKAKRFSLRKAKTVYPKDETVSQSVVNVFSTEDAMSDALIHHGFRQLVSSKTSTAPPASGSGTFPKADIEAGTDLESSVLRQVIVQIVDARGSLLAGHKAFKVRVEKGKKVFILCLLLFLILTCCVCRSCSLPSGPQSCICAILYGSIKVPM
jgi:hypothetical protein